MGARSSIYPTYAVFDRSSVGTFASVETQLATAPTITNPNAWRDSDLDSYTSIANSVAGIDNGGQTTTFDFKRIFFNTQLSYKITSSSSGRTYQLYLDYSTDNVNWTNIYNNTSPATSVTLLGAENSLACRYVRIKFYGSLSTNMETKIYELRLMGSGN